MSLSPPSYSWRPEADCVHLRLAGSDCLPLPHCSEDPWDISRCPSYWKVSRFFISAETCCFCFLHLHSLLPFRYLIFVMCVTTLIATNQIVVLNFSLRSPSTHTMSYSIKHVRKREIWAKTSFPLLFWTAVLLCVQLCLEMVPRFLGMSPLVDDSEVTAEVNGIRERRRSSFGLMQRAEEYVLKQPRSEMMFDKQRERHGLTRSIGELFINFAPCFQSSSWLFLQK